MSTTITGKLNKAANQFQAGDSTGFSVRLGVKYRDPKTKQDEWTNYQAVIFAKAPGQIQFYQNALIEGAVIEVTCEQLKIDSYDGTNGTMLSIDMLNARLGYVFSGQQPQQQQQAPQQGYIPPQPQQVPQQAPQQQYQQQQYAPQQSPMAQNPNNSDPSVPF
jgi:hypothetical protein